MSVPFPPQPVGCPWPTEAWESSAPDAGVDRDKLAGLVDRAFAEPQPPDLGLSLALLVVHRGRVIAERYGPDTGPATTLISWSMAKSITHALFGLLIGDGRIALDSPAPVAEWAGDDRREITIGHLLTMTSGLAFVEDYVDDQISDVLEMLFGAGAPDHAAYAAGKPLVHPPGTVWSYASGTTNILSRIAADVIGGGEQRVATYLRERLFGPIGMRSATPKFDAAGTFVGSSYVYATAADFARFGYLYLRDGTWDGHRLLPPGWADHAHRPSGAPLPDDERHGYGAHWWRWYRSDGTFSANGYEAQRIVVAPERDAVVVRLGKTPAESGANVDAWIDQILACIPPVGTADRWSPE